MSTGLMRAECRKFVPNIFNKTKCSNCFRQKEEHSAEALECNRATRKISKCGYLFVAPGWDFSNPLNRTKRWQRRWFVLYDDGELSYSVDEHPETVPQASIDMNKVLEVTDAEEITGNSYSLAITAPETVHFVKGTCREEAKWWKDVLNVFPRSKGRHKRNATFPGGQTTAILQQSSLSCRSSTDSRPRFNSYHTDGLLRTPSSPQWLHVEEEEDIFPTRDIKISTDPAPESPPTSIDPRQSYPPETPNPDSRTIYRDHQPISSTSPPTRDKIHTEEKARTRRTLNREKRGLKTGRSYTEELYSSTKNEEVFADNFTSIKNSRNLSDGITNILREGKAGDTNEVARRILFETEKSKREEKLKDIADSITRPRTRRHTQTMMNSYERHSASQVKPTRDGDYSEEEKGSISPVVGGTDDVDNQIEKPIRGDPDGCGLDLTSQRYSPSSELRVDLPAEDLLNIKKGWLMKQGNGQEWTKHWFVLRGAALMYYRDPTAEDKGILDGVMDLSSVNSVTEIQVQRNYGFQTISWDDRRYVLSAVTAGIRSNWMTAIRKAAGIPEPVDISLTLGEKLERELERSSSESNNPQYFESKHSSSRNNYLESGIQRTSSSQYLESSRSSSSQFESPSRSSSSSISIPRSPSNQYVENLLQKSSNSQFSDGAGVKRSSSAQSVVTDRNFHFSSDDDYRTASEGSRKENDDWNEATPTPLPPSPPLNRTPISRVKERAKTQTSRSRVYNKRSKSSPPTSRRNTLDSIRTEDVMAVEKSTEPIKRSIILDKVDRHLKEIDELKGQLNLALCERSTAEKELTRLRQRKTETNMQMEEMLRTLKLTEDELKLKNQELEDFDNLKQRYNKLMKEHEGVLTSYRENALNDDWRKMYQQLKEEYANDKRSWDAKLENATNMLQAATERCEMLARELTTSEETVEALKMELSNLSERLMRGIEENEGLYGRMRELEGRCLSASRERGRSVDSLSDLTNVDLDIDLDGLDKERIIEEYEELKGRFEKAIQEIRAMKRELRESHACYDDLELTVINLRQDSKRREENDKAQAALMASRIEDLTLKLTASEKQCRTLKQKISKSESREKRRSLSLKGGESFQISREVEEKLAELEAKINALEQGKPIASVVIKTATPPPEKDTKSKKEDLRSARLRRKSLDSATGSEPMKVLIRLSSLESKIAKVGNKKQPEVKILDEDGSESLGKAISKLQECRALMSSVKSSRRPSSPLNSKSFVSIENLLLEVESILANYEDPSPAAKDEVKKPVECVVYKLESLLSSKLTELMNKRRALSQANQLDEETKLKLLAERLAYESILIKKIKEAVEDFKIDGNHCKNLALRSEIQETNRLINLVRKKINGEDVNLNENSLDHLTKALTEALISEGDLMTDVRKMRKVLSEASSESDVNLDKLLENQRSLHKLVEKYKKEKLEMLARSLATETLCLTAEYEQGRKNNSSEDRRIREAWTLAQEALNKELVQAEISHVTMRCASLYESNAAKDLEANLTLIAEEYKHHEEYVKQVEDCLRKVIDSTVEELTSEYEKYLNQLKNEKHVKTTQQLEEESKECRTLMENFVSVLAQKTLIDARVQVLTKNPYCDRTGVDRRPVVRGVCLKSDANLEARFIYLYQKFSAECMQSVEQTLESRQDLSEAVEALNNCAIGVNKLREALKLEGSRLEDNCESNWSSVRDKCTTLKMEVEDIVKCLQGDKPCTRCDVLEDTLHKMEAQYDEEIQMLRHCHEKEMQDLRGELESQRDSLVCQHEQEQAQLMERARRLERRLGTLDAEYAQQMDNLRTAYHKTLSAELEKDENTEDSIRQRYQSEIEQLRALCEKGLIAVDNSHRRIIAELEEKHRQELAAAAAEKEQALAEETQATLAALDAMRKAHETEVQKEINKFKTEFLKKMQSNHDINALHKEHEAEMEEIKKEILSLSEKYSIKCVESASLEEQLSLVSKQLSQAQQHIMQLDARNKQLRAHLVSEAVQFEDFEATSPRSLKSEDDDKNHGTTRQAHSLDEFRRCRSSENSLPPREPLSLDRYFNRQSWSSKAGGKMYLAEKSGNENSHKERATRWQEPTTLTRAELLRSPKCSLFATTNFNSPSLSQLSGMVAERKKLFEH